MSLTRKLFTLSLLVLMLSCSNKNKENSVNDDAMVNTMNPKELYLFVGTYTSEKGSKGIYVYKFDKEKGLADSLSMVETANPSYMVLNNDGTHIYAVGESGDNSTISSFSFDKETGKMAHINTVASQGADPCYIEIDNSNNSVISANYSGGSISLFSIKNNGELSEANTVLQFSGSGADKTRQASSHLHSVRYSPDKRFLFATDLGADKIYRYSSTESVFDGQPAINKSDMVEFDTPEGMGPRHFDFHPSSKYLYVLGELSGEIVVYDYISGDITQKQVVVSDSLQARGAGDIHVSPDGRFVYASNRLKGDGISIFSVNEDNGELEKIGYQDTGVHPRNFIISPDGRFMLVACKDDHVIEVYNINDETGLLSRLNNDIVVDSPVCLKFLGE